MGIEAAKISDQMMTRPITTQKFCRIPIRPRTTTPTVAVAISADVRRRKRPRMRGAASPPRICAPATIAAARPAIT